MMYLRDPHLLLGYLPSGHKACKHLSVHQMSDTDRIPEGVIEFSTILQPTIPTYLLTENRPASLKSVSMIAILSSKFPIDYLQYIIRQ